MSLRRRILWVFLVVNGVTLGLLLLYVLRQGEVFQEQTERDQTAIQARSAHLLALAFKDRVATELDRSLGPNDREDTALVCRTIGDQDYWDENPLVQEYLDKAVLLRYDGAGCVFFNPRPRFIFQKDAFDRNEMRQMVASSQEVSQQGDLVFGSLDVEKNRDWGFFFRLKPPIIVAADPGEMMRTVFFLTVPGALFLLTFVYFFFNRSVLRPLASVQQAAKRISDGDYDQPVEFRTRGDELGSLARSMNTMMGELAQYRQNMQSRVDDATARIEEARRHLLMAQQLSATGRVAAGMAHEINNPLSGVLNAVVRLADPTTPADQKSRLESIVRDALLRIQQLVKRILESTPRGDVQLEPIDASEILHRTIDLAEHRIKSDGIELQVDLQDGLILLGSSHELGQAFLNLVLNACDAMPDGGRLGIGAVAENDQVVIEFSDSGEGIPEEERQRVFELFYTTKAGHGGSGLGLGMVHNIVTGHGGTIAVREADDGGALFVLRFPEARSIE